MNYPIRAIIKALIKNIWVTLGIELLASAWLFERQAVYQSKNKLRQNNFSGFSIDLIIIFML